MTQKINGAVYPGVWVEKQVAFVKLTFNIDISAIVAANLYEFGTTTAPSTNTVADSTFGIVESALVQALKTLDTRSTLLGVSKYDASTKNVDVMLGVSEGWFSDNVGVIATGLPVTNALATITVAGTDPADTVGTLVSVNPTAVTFSIKFGAFSGTLPIATLAAGDLAVGPGATSAATPTNSPTGTTGYYPVLLATV